MKVELLVVPDCANEQPAAELLRSALDDVGLAAVTFATTVVDTMDAAERLSFAGSPTILINGVDPFAVPGSQPALACRLYRHPSGLRGVPELAALRRFLEEGAGRSGQP